MRHLFLEGRDPFVISTLGIQGAATGKDFSTLRDYLGSQTVYGLESGLDSYIGAAKIFFDLPAIEHGLHLLHNDSDFDRIAKVSALKIWQPTPAGRG